MTGAAGTFTGIQGFTNSQTETTLTNVSVPNVVTPVCLNNPRRLTGLFINTSSDLIYMGFDQSISIGDGILLVPNGGSFNTKSWEDYGLTGYAMFAISATGAGILTFVETQTNN